MGWSGGTELMLPIIEALKTIEPSASLRRRFYKPVILAFQDHDWDTESECIGEDPAFDEVLKKVWKKQGIDWENPE